MTAKWEGHCSKCGIIVRGGGENYKPPPKNVPVLCIWCWMKEAKRERHAVQNMP